MSFYAICHELEVHELKPSTFKMAEALDQNPILQKMKKSDIVLLL